MLAPQASPARSAGHRRPVRLLVPQTAGTTNDLIARVVAPGLAQHTGRPFIVENRIGASGMLGMDAAAKARPDGSTLLSNVSNTLALPYLYKNVPFDVLEDFAPVGIEGYGNHALAVHHTVPAADLAEFIAYAHAHPGLEYAAPGRATHHHLCMAMIQAMTGIRLTPVLYKGSAGATADLVTGQVRAMVLPIQIAAEHARRGQIRILGGTRQTRFPLYPDVPTLHEQGLTGFDVEPWFALWAPRGTPAPLLDDYNHMLNQVLAHADAAGTLAQHGVVATPGTIDDLRRKAHAEYQMWGKVLAQLGIRPE